MAFEIVYKNRIFTKPIGINDPRKQDKCRGQVNLLIKYGYLKREPCEICGAKAYAHHEDYNDPLNIRWLCPKHHIKLHYLFRKFELH